MKHIKACKKTIKEISHSLKRKELEIRCRGCHAAIQEMENKYLAAGYNYFEIAKYAKLKGTNDKTSKVLSRSLNNCIKCTILATPCDGRDKLLQKLYEDKRSELEYSINFKIIEHMHHNRIISQNEHDEFDKRLPIKDRIKRIGEYTILQKSVYEHNLRSVAKLYKNIRIKDLSILLGISMTASEDITRLMIQENRLNARIDQIDEEITFNEESETLYSFNKHIEQLLLDLNNVIESIKECRIDNI